MLYLICQNHDEVEQGRFFSFNHILCSHVLPFIYNKLKSVHFPHVNTQMPCHNQIQSIAMAATCMFLETSATANHTQYTSALRVSVQQGWISFETVDICENS